MRSPHQELHEARNLEKALSPSPCLQGEMHPPAMRVLLVDDVRVQHMIISRQLARCNVNDMIYAENGAKGLAAMKEAHFDLVLSDLVLPVIQGDEMVANFRAWEMGAGRLHRQRIICITGDERMNDACRPVAGWV